MAANFSANQFQQEFVAHRLGNWQVPKWHPSRPVQRTKPTKIISNDSGHLLPGVTRPLSNPWGHFQSTWYLPDRISKKQAFELNAPHSCESRWAKPSQRRKKSDGGEVVESSSPENKKTKKCPIHGKKVPVDSNTDDNDNNELTNYDEENYNPEDHDDVVQSDIMNIQDNSSNNHKIENAAICTCPQQNEYIPGDLTSPVERHSSRDILEKQTRIRDTGRVEHVDPNDLYVQKHECKYYEGCPEPIDKHRPTSPHILGDETVQLPSLKRITASRAVEKEEMTRDVTEKPGERNTSPLIPAYCNFQVARKMHVENLEHQPLPDSIMDRAFRRMQAQGAINPELALNVVPTATGIGVKTYMAGPTHCTKLKIYRPKTCGVVPKPLDRSKYDARPQTGIGQKMRLGAMDLAIQWDHRPLDPRDEPKRAAHIDGSDASAGPAVFTVVKTPRTPNFELQTERSGGVFYNTHGEHNFFDKDIIRQKLPFASKSDPVDKSCRCDKNAQQANRYNRENMHPSNFSQHESRPRSVPRSRNGDGQSRRYKSASNLSEMVHPSNSHLVDLNHSINNKESNEHKVHRRCHNKHKKTETKKNIRLCDQLPPTDESKKGYNLDMAYKYPFKAGIPNSNSSGTCTSFDSGCSSMSSSNTSSHSSKSSIRVPKPRHPYAKRDYIIDTLAPPFACCRGGAGQGGYPEHWRLASVYQHAYKPIEQRRRPLLATVYQ